MPSRIRLRFAALALPPALLLAGLLAGAAPAGAAPAGAAPAGAAPAGAAPAATSTSSSTASLPPNPGLAGIDASATPTNFWLASASGGVWNFGRAPHLGSPAGLSLVAPVVGITATADGKGYWLVAADGGIFTYGDAGFHGSIGGHVLFRPVVGMAPTPDGQGYWEVAADGGIFTFGDAGFYGSMGGKPLSAPVVGMAATPDGKGYWLVARDGGVFAFGDAAFYGSPGGTTHEPSERVVPTADGHGYWVVDQNGTAHPYGDAAGAPPVQGLLFSPDTPGDKAVLWALAQLGKPYVWGGMGPAGFDCSGLALAAWEHGAGVSFARVSDDQYHTAGTSVPLGDLQAGDLVFWATDPGTWTTVYHTAMVVGGGRLVEAAGSDVQLSSLSQWGAAQLMPNGRRP